MTELFNAPHVVRVGRVPITVGDLSDAIDTIEDAGRSRAALSIRFVNSYTIAAADQDDTYAAALSGPGHSFADGAPVAWAVRWQGSSARARRQRSVRGPSVFEEMLLRPRETKLRHFLLGASQETLKAIEERTRKESPATIIAGVWSPPFATHDELLSEAVSRVSATECDVVWLGLGSPKQDLLANHLAIAVNRPCIGVGAAFDFLGGTKREAPKMLQGSGFEWTYRLATEPRRLWKRYTVGSARFLWAVGSGMRITGGGR